MAGRFICCLMAMLLLASMVRAQEPTPVTSTEVYQELLRRLEASENRLRHLEAVLVPAPVPDEMPTQFINLAYWLETADPEVAQARWQAKEEAKKAEEKKDDTKKKDEPKKWYEKYSIRGYTQFRDNEVLYHKNGTAPAQYAQDRSVGADQNFFFRRARVILQGDVSDRLFIYLQPDFAIAPPGSVDGTHFMQLRDWYGDVYATTDKVHRFRVGQSKVPYGWENMQSSSNRIPLDRIDGINSATPNERDLGIYYYWTPEKAQKFFRDVLDQGLKGSGNYGMFALGGYNGQGGSFQEQNDNIHLVTRLTLPIQFDNCQRMEVGVQAYTGKFTVFSAPIRALGQGPSIRPQGTLETGNRPGIRDERVAASFIWYPQPFGFQTEWNVGRGPALNDAQTAVEETSLTGGYAMANYKWDHCYGTTFPYVRYNYYRGGYKIQRNAPYTKIDEFEFGAEWQIFPAFELTCAYMITDRTNVTAVDRVGTIPYRQFEGHVLRFQFQMNY